MSRWLVKDFHVLYRAAKAATEETPEGRGGQAMGYLVAQLQRLQRAFEICEAERKGAGVEAQRLTEAERTALNALHRWLHSSGSEGDCALIADAQAFHEQVEVERPGDCARLEEEERIARREVE